jgi:predicted TIM-barrel fold metal-dependent hydrolase
VTAPPELAPPVVDVHVHLAGLGQGGTGCFVSRRMRRTLVYHILRRYVGLDPEDPRADRLYAERLARLVRGAEHVDRVVVFAMDGVYGSAGELDCERSHMYVPNDYLFEVCRDHDVFLPGASVNPARRDATDELERCAARGAVLVKWLPPLQLFDPADPAYVPFYRAMARLRLPLLGHTGCEHTFPDMSQELGHPGRYRAALDEGVTVVFAHCGVACRLHRSHHKMGDVIDLMARYPNLHADTSALCSFLKFHHLEQIPFERFPGRFLHGSDYPIPPLAIPFVRKLGLRKAIRLTRHPNALDVDWQVKAAVGVPDHVFGATATVLADRIRIWDALRARAA